MQCYHYKDKFKVHFIQVKREKKQSNQRTIFTNNYP